MLDCLQGDRDRLFNELVVLIAVEESAGDECRATDRLTGPCIDRCDHDNDAIVSKGASIAEDDFADFAHRRTINKDRAMLNRLATTRAAVCRELDRRAVIDDEYRGGWYPHLCCKSPVGHLHAHITVHRHEVFRLGEREHHLQLLLRGVTRDVHLCDGVIDDVGAGPEEVVDRSTDRLFVAWNR